MKMLAGLCILCLFAASSAMATVVWNLDPNRTAGTAGSASQSASNDAFAILGSSTFRDSGVQTEGISGRPADMVFASIADLTNGKLTSASSLSGTVMTVALQSTLTPFLEISALFPIIGLVAAVAVTQFLRRRRMAQLRAAALDAH
jgi:hypothetical protein